MLENGSTAIDGLSGAFFEISSVGLFAMYKYAAATRRITTATAKIVFGITDRSFSVSPIILPLNAGSVRT